MSAAKAPDIKDEIAGGVTVSGVSGRYAIALFELALDAGVLEGVAVDLDRLEAAIADSADLAGVVTSPLYSRNDQGRAVEALAGAINLNDLTRRFLGVISANRRLSVLPDMIGDFRKLLARHKGEVSADVVSAHKLTAAQVKALKEKLKSMVGRDVNVDATVDESLLGGLIVKVGSKMIDSSIRTKLANLQISMKEVG